MHTFTTYQEWHTTITGVCGLTLNRDYCAQRIRALGNEQDSSTRNFLKAYGTEYRDLVVSWFRQAEKEAVS
jgi:hypothetical protein